MILRRFDSWPMGNPRSPTVTVRRVNVEGDGLLRGWGHAVTTAAAYAEAVAALDAQRFNLLISDIGLPDGSGVDLMKEVRTRLPTPGIALSGFGHDEDLRRSREAGFTAHLTKPVNFRALQGLMAQFASSL